MSPNRLSSKKVGVVWYSFMSPAWNTDSKNKSLVSVWFLTVRMTHSSHKQLNGCMNESRTRSGPKETCGFLVGVHRRRLWDPLVGLAQRCGPFPAQGALILACFIALLGVTAGLVVRTWRKFRSLILSWLTWYHLQLDRWDYARAERVARINPDRNAQITWLGFNFWMKRNRLSESLWAVWRDHWGFCAWS